MLDQLLGEPPTRRHPVVGFGSTMRWVETVLHRDSRAAGVAHLATGIGVATGTAALLRHAVGPTVATAVAATVSIAGRMLLDEAGAVEALDAVDLVRARARLPSLVGRDVSMLDDTEIVRAVIESVAENTVDAVVGPLFWATVGGATVVLVHRAVNTLDAMIGHRTEHYERFGWASARAEDIANWVPARLGALAVIALRPRRATAIATTIRRDAPAHPSPNGGVIEGAFAAALAVRLGGANRYGGTVEHRGWLGDGRPPTVADGRRAIRLGQRLGALAAIVAAALTRIWPRACPPPRGRARQRARPRTRKPTR